MLFLLHANEASTRLCHALLLQPPTSSSRLSPFFSIFIPNYITASKTTSRLCDKSVGSSALVPPGRWQDTNSLVVARQTVDTGLDQDQAELAVLVLAVALKVLAHGHGLLDEHVQVLGDLGGKTCVVSLSAWNRAEADVFGMCDS